MSGLVPRINQKYNLKDAFIAFKSLFLQYPDCNKDKYFLNHARTGLRIALRSLNLTSNAKVGVMAFNCYTVMNAVKTAGLEIEFIDVNDDFTLDVEDLKQKKTKLSAIIVTHLFGIPNDIEIIKKVCPGIPIIEDCAHAYLSKINGKPTGNSGDFSVFSIGLGKFPSIGSGGILRVNNNLYAQEVKNAFSYLDEQSFKKEFVSIFKNIILGILHHKYIYKYFTKPFLKSQNKVVDDELRYENNEFKISKSSYALYMKKVKDVNSFLEKQQKNSDSIIELLNRLLATKIRINELNVYEPNRFMIPFLIENKREEFIEYFKKNGIEVGSHFSNSILWAKKFGYIEGNCKNSEKISTQIVVCPCHYNLNSKSVQLINHIIRNLI